MPQILVNTQLKRKRKKTRELVEKKSFLKISFCVFLRHNFISIVSTYVVLRILPIVTKFSLFLSSFLGKKIQEGGEIESRKEKRKTKPINLCATSMLCQGNYNLQNVVVLHTPILAKTSNIYISISCLRIKNIYTLISFSYNY